MAHPHSAAIQPGNKDEHKRLPKITITSQRRVRRRTQAIYPDCESLYSLMRDNCGASLFVLPILWTDIHPRLLGVQFTAQEPIMASAAVVRSRARQVRLLSQSTDAQVALSYDLKTLLATEDLRPFCKTRAIKNIVSSLFPLSLSRPSSVAELDLHFGDRVFRGAVRIPIVWRPAYAEAAFLSFDSAVTRAISSFGVSGSGGVVTQENGGGSGQTSLQSSQDATSGPVLAYINRTHLMSIRQNLFRVMPGPQNGDYRNTPVTRLQGLRSKQLIPADANRDPYLVGVFLSMAQAHFYDTGLYSRLGTAAASQSFMWSSNNRRRGEKSSTVSDFHNLTLHILSHDDDTSEFLVYTAVVTAAFLQRFANPTKAPPSLEDTGMRIDYTRVPVWPVAGLGERLGQVLGKEISSESLQNKAASLVVEPTQEAPPKKKQASTTTITATTDSLKRKRNDKASLAAEFHVDRCEVDDNDSDDDDEDVPAGHARNAPAMPLSPRTKRQQTRSLSSSLAVC